MDDHPATIIRLVEQAVRDWARAVSGSDELDPEDGSAEPAYSMFYMDADRPNQIQTRGAERDRCGIWIEPSDVCSENGNTNLMVDVTVAHRVDGQPTVTEFQVWLTEDLKALDH